MIRRLENVQNQAFLSFLISTFVFTKREKKESSTLEINSSFHVCHGCYKIATSLLSNRNLLQKEVIQNTTKSKCYELLKFPKLMLRSPVVSNILSSSEAFLHVWSFLFISMPYHPLHHSPSHETRKENRVRSYKA